jgi:hypothetical protein
VKKNNVKKGIFTALLLASPFVTAGTQYPASDFQPKVVYQDESYQHQSSGSSMNLQHSQFLYYFLLLPQWQSIFLQEPIYLLLTQPYVYNLHQYTILLAEKSLQDSLYLALLK